MNTRVSYQLQDSVATITLDDGKANVVSPPMLEETQAALDRAAADRATVVFRGRPGRFCAGFDLPSLTAGDAGSVKLLRGGFELAERLLSFPQPVVIACTGHALAMGVFLLMAGDHSIGIEGGYKIGANEVAIGLVMPHAAIEVCRQRIAPAYLSRVVNNAEIFTPAEARTAGFFDELVAEGELDARAQAAAARLAKLNTKVHAATKLRLRELLLKNLRAAMDADEAEFRARLGLR